MKTCSKCKAGKPEAEFGWLNKRKGELRPDCRACRKVWAAAHYRANKPTYNARNRANYEQNKPRYRAYSRERYLVNREARCARQREYAKQNPEAVRRTYLRKYGLTLEDYDRLLLAQGGACAGCKGPPRGRGERNGWYQVDHDHITGRVRGLLCGPCNVALGAARDQTEILMNLAAYLPSKPVPGTLNSILGFSC